MRNYPVSTCRPFALGQLTPPPVPRAREPRILETTLSALLLHAHSVCRGRITMETANHFRSEVETLAQKHKFVRADLGGIDFVDSEALASFWVRTFSPYVMAAT